MKPYFITASMFLLFIVSSCKREVIPASDVELGKDYFPLTEGHFVEYAVDSVIYNDFTKKIDTTTIEFKDVVGEEFLDGSNRTSHIVKRYSRKTASAPWEEHLTYFVTPTVFNLEVVENNLRFIKLIFPVKPNGRWYGNAFISSQFNPELQWLNNTRWDYRYMNIGEPYSTQFLNFENTASIQQINQSEGDSTNINLYSDRIFAKEVYAKNVGLVYRNLTYWVYQSDVKFRKGFSVTYRAKSHN